MENKNIKDKEINKMIKYGDLREWDVSEGLVMNYEIRKKYILGCVLLRGSSIYTFRKSWIFW